MRPGLADFSPTVPVALAVGIGVSLSVLLLPSGVVQKGPTPVLPAFGGAAGRVVADLPVAAGGRARKVAASAPPQIVVALRPPAGKARQVHRPARTAIVRRAPSAPVQAAPVQAAPPAQVVPPAAPVTPVTKTRLFRMPSKAKGKARGHNRGQGQEPKAATPAPPPPGRGRALGRSNEHQNRLPPGLAKKAPPALAPGLPPPPPKGNGEGNEGKGDGGGNGHKGPQK
jgi:hypothetical protein